MEIQEEKPHQKPKASGGIIDINHPMTGSYSIVVPAAMWEEMKRQDYVGYSVSVGTMLLNHNPHTVKFFIQEACEQESEDEEG